MPRLSGSPGERALDGDQRRESEPWAGFASRAEALAEASRLADADQPSEITLDNGDGMIVEKHLFGRDLSEEIGA